MSDTAAPELTDLRGTLPPLEQVQGLTVADLSNATEAVYARGWEQAMAAAQERLDEIQRINAEILTREQRDARASGEQEGFRRARDLVAADLKGTDSYTGRDAAARWDSPVRKAARLLKLLDDITDNLPASISKRLRDDLNEADTLALAVSNAIDKHAGAGR